MADRINFNICNSAKNSDITLFLKIEFQLHYVCLKNFCTLIASPTPGVLSLS
jgi:hypothetical protein